MIQNEDILDAYYLRQSAEHYFDLAKWYATLTLLRIHSEEVVRGMVMPNFHRIFAQTDIDASQKHVRAFQTVMPFLRSQNCRIYDDEVFVDEP